MKKAVIFDLDGLLIDSEVISHRLYDELLHRYGKSVTVAEYARDYSGKTGAGQHDERHCPGTICPSRWRRA